MEKEKEITELMQELDERALEKVAGGAPRNRNKSFKIVLQRLRKSGARKRLNSSVATARMKVKDGSSQNHTSNMIYRD